MKPPIDCLRHTDWGRDGRPRWAVADALKALAGEALGPDAERWQA